MTDTRRKKWCEPALPADTHMLFLFVISSTLELTVWSLNVILFSKYILMAYFTHSSVLGDIEDMKIRKVQSCLHKLSDTVDKLLAWAPIRTGFESSLNHSVVL